MAANLTERGFKWFFRATPVAGDFARAYSDFLKEQKAAGQKIGSIALVNENTEYGNSVASVITERVRQGRPQRSRRMIAYSANTTDVQPQVLQLKEKNPDVVIFISYTSDAILYAKTMKELNWKPAIMIADNAGFNDPSFVKTSGALVEGLVNRSSFAVGKPGIVDLHHQRALQEEDGGDDLDDPSARAMQGFLVLADAINRAGSTDPAKIQAALKATDLQGRPDGHGLQRREVRRQGPEHAGLEPDHADAGRQVRARLAEGRGRRRAEAALQGLVAASDGRRGPDPSFRAASAVMRTFDPMSSILLQVIVSGLLLGAVYALFSSGLTLIWGMMNVVNFAHGDFVMLGMYAAVHGLDGARRRAVRRRAGRRHGARDRSACSSYFLLVRHIMKGPMLAQILGTFGLALLLRYSAFWYFGANFKTLPDNILVGGSFVLGGIRIEASRAAGRRGRACWSRWCCI